MSAALAALHAQLRAEGGLLADALAPAGALADATADHGALVAHGPRTAADPDEYALVVEAVREGYLLHYGEPRVIRTPDRDLALLAGDRLYALGLARLAALGDAEAVGALAAVIALGAQAHAGEDPALAEAVWDAGVAQVGWGDDPALEAARAAAQAGEPGARAALQEAARHVAGDLARRR